MPHIIVSPDLGASAGCRASYQQPNMDYVTTTASSMNGYSAIPADGMLSGKLSAQCFSG
jgi:hypothetical protein